MPDVDTGGASGPTRTARADRRVRNRLPTGVATPTVALAPRQIRRDAAKRGRPACCRIVSSASTPTAPAITTRGPRVSQDQPVDTPRGPRREAFRQRRPPGHGDAPGRAAGAHDQPGAPVDRHSGKARPEVSRRARPDGYRRARGGSDPHPLVALEVHAVDDERGRTAQAQRRAKVTRGRVCGDDQGD